MLSSVRNKDYSLSVFQLSMQQPNRLDVYVELGRIFVRINDLENAKKVLLGMEIGFMVNLNKSKEPTGYSIIFL